MCWNFSLLWELLVHKLSWKSHFPMEIIVCFNFVSLCRAAFLSLHPLAFEPLIHFSRSQKIAHSMKKNYRGTNHSSQFRRFLREAKLWNNEWNNNFTNIETISSWCLFHSCRHRTLAASSLWRRFFFLTQIHRNPIYGNLYDNHQILNALM